MTTRPGLLRGSKIKNYKGSNALRVTWSPPPGFSKQMRELHLKLRSLSLENVTCPDSERYPFLKELIRLDKKLHDNWDKYDHYIPE